MRAEEIRCEWEEDGLHLIIDGDSPDPEYQVSILDFVVTDPEALYKEVREKIEPWLREMKQARRERARLRRSSSVMHCAPDDIEEDAYDPSDPKHPNWHSIHADHYDAREGK